MDFMDSINVRKVGGDVWNVRMTMDIVEPVSDRGCKNYVLQQWIQTASVRADYHCDKAYSLRRTHIVLSTLVLVTTAMSTVVSAIVPSISTSVIWGVELSYLVAALNALTAVSSGYQGLQDPAGRRREHLIAENIWDNLGRDISVCLRNDTVEDSPEDFDKAVREFQRRVDNAETISPP